MLPTSQHTVACVDAPSLCDAVCHHLIPCPLLVRSLELAFKAGRAALPLCMSASVWFDVCFARFLGLSLSLSRVIEEKKRKKCTESEEPMRCHVYEFQPLHYFILALGV